MSRSADDGVPSRRTSPGDAARTAGAADAASEGDTASAAELTAIANQRDRLPNTLTPVAFSDDGLIMGTMHAEHPVHGVQFHPESIASEHGAHLIRNFLEIARDFNDRRRERRAA